MILPTSNYRVGTVAEGSRGILQGFVEGKVRHRETMMKDPLCLPHLAHEAIGLGPATLVRQLPVSTLSPFLNLYKSTPRASFHHVSTLWVDASFAKIHDRMVSVDCVLRYTASDAFFEALWEVRNPLDASSVAG